MSQRIERTAEHVSAGHPDKFCDQVADTILDEILRLAAEKDRTRYVPKVRTAIECLVKDNLLVVSGEVKLPQDIRGELDVVRLAREVWKSVGYSDIWSGGYGHIDRDQAQGELTVINHLRSQSPDIGEGAKQDAGDGTGTDNDGAGDQGIMVGYATDETPEMMPREWVLARNLCQKLHDLRVEGALGWLRSDCKTQVTLDKAGTVTSVVIAAQHSEDISIDDIKTSLLEQVVGPMVGDVSKARLSINGTGRFVIGGPTGDAGVVGRKIVVDAYGPRVSVGGGAYSGKDPTKVDRSAAYLCRYLAKAAVSRLGAKECTVTIAYGIGKREPEMLTAITETGHDLSAQIYEKFGERFGDTVEGKLYQFSPGAIIRELKLREPNGWSYRQTASYGHYGRDIFPWEKPANI
ncbi:MAG TPA: methionine adenosyltransferase [Thermoanaerobaculia bacterium]